MTFHDLREAALLLATIAGLIILATFAPAIFGF
jgi:hypothetical protein